MVSQVEEPLLTQPLEEWRALSDRAVEAVVVDGVTNGGGSSESDSAEQSRVDNNNSSSEDNKPSDVSMSLPMFRTAGKNMEIHVSNEGLSKAAALFSRADDDAQRSHQVAKNDQVGSSKSADVDSINVQENSSLSTDQTIDNFIRNNNLKEPILAKEPLPVFQTGGKNRTIQVSKESILKANDFFSGFGGKEINVDIDPKESQSSRKEDFSPQSSSVESDLNGTQIKPVDAGKNTTQHLPVFQTAGKNVAIYASAESLTEANKIFSDDGNGSFGDSVVRPTHIAQHNVRDATHNRPESESKANNLFSDVGADMDFRSMPVFQTAGKKQTIQVSTESMSKANAIFSKLDSETAVVADGSNTLDSAASVPASVFQTAGKGIAVKVSAESLSRANNLFSNIGQEADAFLNAAQCNDGKSLSLSTFKSAAVNTETHKSSVNLVRATSQLRKDVPQNRSSTNHLDSVSSKSPAFTSLASLKGNASTIATAPQTAVFNPYANRRQIPHSPKKRTIAQVNKNAYHNTSPKVMRGSTSTIVNNPYAKPKSNALEPKTASHTINYGRQSFVKNPYATKNRSSINATSVQSDKASNPKTPAQSAESSVSLSDKTNSTASVPRPMPTSRFFSMADRLPSRNVSYKPAEILSIGELYRYLYHQRNETASATEQNTSTIETFEPAYRELTSVRVTGVLLSSTYSDSGDGYTQLYGKGQWLLIGDPLEKTRFAQKPPHGLSKSKTPLVNKVDDSATPKPSNSTEKPALSEFSLATPLPSKPPSTLNNSKAAARSTGLLNDKKRKLVYNKAPGRNSLSSSKGLMNAKKFQTPKRVGPDSSSINSINLTKGCPISSRSKGMLHHGKNRSPSAIILNHPSPIVPVWNGSTRDGNGLDGSVIGDLVMIMGEILVELCERCKDGSQEDTSASKMNEEDIDSAPKMSPSARVQDVRVAARLLAAMSSSEDATNAKKRCTQCVKFLRARFVKNANGTDMNLQQEALRVRREYMKRRNDDMTSLFPSSLGNSGIGSGPFL